MPKKDFGSVDVKSKNRESILETITNTFTGTLTRMGTLKKNKKNLHKNIASHEEIEGLMYKRSDGTGTQAETDVLDNPISITSVVSKGIKIELTLSGRVIEKFTQEEKIDSFDESIIRVLGSKLNASLEGLVSNYMDEDSEGLDYSSKLNFNLVMPDGTKYELQETPFDNLRLILDSLKVPDLKNLKKYIKDKLLSTELKEISEKTNFYLIKKFLLEVEKEVCSILKTSEYGDSLKESIANKKLEISNSLIEISKLLPDSPANHIYDEVTFSDTDSEHDYDEVILPDSDYEIMDNPEHDLYQSELSSDPKKGTFSKSTDASLSESDGSVVATDHGENAYLSMKGSYNFFKDTKDCQNAEVVKAQHIVSVAPRHN